VENLAAEHGGTTKARPHRGRASVSPSSGEWGAGRGQRQRVVMPKPTRSRPKPISRFQCPMCGIGYVVWLM